MMTPDLQFWTRLLVHLAVEAACVVGVALLLDRLIRAAFWRRALWQSAAVCLLLLTASELSGFGRGLASFLFGHARPEQKFVLRTGPVAAAPSPLPPPPPPRSFSPAAVTVPSPVVKPEIVRPVWWPGLLWLGGGLVILGRVAAAQILFISLRHRRPQLAHGDLNDRVAAILQRLAVRRKIGLLQSPGLAGPIAFGILRPSVGLPVDFAAKFSRAEQDAMLAHELAHLASHDPLWYLLADVSSAALWWHPQAWWARRRLHRASELAADEAALIFPDGPGALAGCLVTLGKQMTQLPGASRMGVEGGGFRSNLAERVQRLLRLADTARQPSYGWRAQAARFGVIITISAAAIGLSGCLQSRDALKQPTLQASLSQSWDASPASTVWHSALPAKKPEPPPAPIPAVFQSAKADDSVAAETGGISNPPATNSTPNPSDGRQTIVRKLQDIKLGAVPDGFEQGLPLSEVLNILTKLSNSKDVDQIGVNFLFNPRAGGNTAGELIDPSTITIRITPPLKNVNLLQLLDAIRQMADSPIDFSVADYAVWFFVKPPATAALASRIQPFTMPSPGTTQGYQAVIGRLQNLRLKELPDGFEQGLPLSEVLRALNKFSISNDVDRIGVNFLFNPRVGANAGGELIDPGTITIKITPPLKNVTLLQLLDAIRQVADQPIDFSVADYAVWFFVKRPEMAAQQTRMFHVDPKVFVRGMEEMSPQIPAGQANAASGGLNGGGGIGGGIGGIGGGIGTGPDTSRTNYTFNDNYLVTRYFGSQGINLTNNGAFAFFNQRTGDILVRTTAQDLDKLERAIELINKVPPQIQIDIKFASVPPGDTKGLGFSLYLANTTITNGASATASTDLPALTGILTDPQFRLAIQTIEQRDGADILSMPRITTESGRQAHVAVTESLDIVTNIPSGRNAAAPGNTTNKFDDGPAIDVIPTVSGNGFTIQLVLKASLREFLGFDKAAQSAPQSNVVPSLQTGLPTNTMGPVPRYRSFSAATTISVWDGQTVVLGGPMQESDAIQKRSTNAQSQNVMVFITARIIDPAGNPVHTEEDMPFAKKSVPPQPPATGQPK
ncbi:MAG: M56 family metallopeptidase [Verrucomicrobiota bacterium]|jgi:beta-lactamase regulating signal transducer with metallopeptidase domain